MEQPQLLELPLYRRHISQLIAVPHLTLVTVGGETTKDGIENSPVLDKIRSWREVGWARIRIKY